MELFFLHFIEAILGAKELISPKYILFKLCCSHVAIIRRDVIGLKAYGIEIARVSQFCQRALIYFRSGLASVHCLLIHKESNEWPSQAEGRRLPGPTRCSSPGHFARMYANFCDNKSVRRLLGSPHFARTPIRRSRVA